MQQEGIALLAHRAEDVVGVVRALGTAPLRRGGGPAAQRHRRPLRDGEGGRGRGHAGRPRAAGRAAPAASTRLRGATAPAIVAAPASAAAPRRQPGRSPAAIPAGGTRRLRVDVEVVEGSPVPAVRGFLVLKRLEGAGRIVRASPGAAELRAGQMPGRKLTVEVETDQPATEVERTLAQIADLGRDPGPGGGGARAHPSPDDAAEAGRARRAAPHRAGPRRDARRVPRRVRRAPARHRPPSRAGTGHARGRPARPRGRGRPAPGHRQGPARAGHVGAHDPAHRPLRPAPPGGARPGPPHRASRWTWW